MTCYFCKAEISRAMRTYVKARNHREKDNFRDLCRPCYLDHLGDKVGSVIWVEEEASDDNL